MTLGHRIFFAYLDFSWSRTSIFWNTPFLFICRTVTFAVTITLIVILKIITRCIYGGKIQ